MIHQSLLNLWYGFSIALQPGNLMWAFFGVVVGNLVGVLPGLGAMSTVSLLLPLTYVLAPVPSVLMIAGIFYGAQYGGSIGAILLNLPSHAPHAVTCLDGYPMTKAGKGGTALGITMLASFVAASFGITMMVFFSPILIGIAFKFGPAEIFSIMLLGLLAGSTMSHGSPLKGVAATVFGIMCGIVGTDLTTGAARLTFGLPDLQSGIELVALSLGLFAVADFLRNVNRSVPLPSARDLHFSNMLPKLAEIRQAFWPTIRGTLVGTAFGAMPGTGPTITTFIAYALERRISKTPERFGHGAIEGVAAPEASTHAKTQIDFIPTMCLGIPGDPLMALILGALLIQGVQPGPRLITQHPDIFWGLVASFWIGNVFLILLNVPLIGVWVRLLRVPYRFLYPAALFFMAAGIYSTHNSFFEVAEGAVFGIVGAALLALRFPVSPILLGFVLGPMIEENFRRALLISQGNFMVFLQRPISASFIAACLLLVAVQAIARTRRARVTVPTAGGAAPT